MDQQQVLEWLRGFLEPANLEHHDHYFTHCTEHTHHNWKSRATEQIVTRKGEKHYYCVDCITGPLCETGFKADHGGHRVLQVRKASHTDAIRINDISRLVNVHYIQTYVINEKKIVFLPSRPQTKPVKGSPSYCDECRRSLHDKFARFCSLSCKLKVIEGHPKDDSLTLFLSGEVQSGMSGVNAGSGFLRPASPSPALPATKRARATSKKRARTASKEEFAPCALMEPPHQALDKLHSAYYGPSPTSVLLSHPDHDTDAVSPGYKSTSSSSSQDSLETRYLRRFRYLRRCCKHRRKAEPSRALGVGISNMGL